MIQSGETRALRYALQDWRTKVDLRYNPDHDAWVDMMSRHHQATYGLWDTPEDYIKTIQANQG